MTPVAPTPDGASPRTNNFGQEPETARPARRHGAGTKTGRRILSPPHKRRGAMRALIALYAIALIAAMPAEAQKAQTAAPSAAGPGDTPPASAKRTLPDGPEWSSVGATAQCRDGTFYHDKPSARTCTDRGGVRQWLGHEQPLIR